MVLQLHCKEGKIFGNLERHVHEACTWKSLAIGDHRLPTIFTGKMEIPVTENQTVRAFENMECYLRESLFQIYFLEDHPFKLYSFIFMQKIHPGGLRC